MLKTKLTAELALTLTVMALAAGGQQAPTIHQNAEQSSCSNIVAMSGAKVDCANLSPAQRKALQNIPAIMKSVLENQDSLDAILKKIGEMQKAAASLRYDRIEIVPSESCGIRALVPKGWQPISEADKMAQQIEQNSPELGKWVCIRMVFVNNGTASVYSAGCRVNLGFDLDPKLPPNKTSIDELEEKILDTIPFREMGGIYEERQPGDSVMCTSPLLPEEAIKRIRDGTAAVTVYGVAKYKSSSIPSGMIGITEVGRYFINNFDQSLPAASNRVAIEPDN